MIEKTFEYEGATITCKRATVRSRLQQDFIYSALEVNTDTTAFEMYTYTSFARFMTQCAIEGELDFVPPNIGADNKTMQAGLEAFLNLDGDFHDELVAALNEVDRALPKKTQEAESMTS